MPNGSNVKKIIFLLACFLSSPSFGEELCASWEKKIEPDMQMDESLFTKENADDSAQFLEKVKNKEITDYGWYEPGNGEKIVRGYRLKKQALESLKNNPNFETPELKAFCEFIVNEAFYFD